MEYQVKIDAFEGPLDLLLYLIKDTQISIDDINVTHITEQYINFIHAMEKLNLEVASEYLVMAAHLVYIKSKMMLPKTIVDEENINYEENPEEKLKMRLKIYKLFKDITPFLRNLEEERSTYLNKIPTDLSNEIKLEVKDILVKDNNVYDLLSAFNKVLRRYMLHKPMKTKIQQQSITIEDRIISVRKMVKKHERLNFIDLYTLDDSKEVIVLTFMAILELAKEKEIKISQDDLFENIFIDYIERSEENEQ